MNNEGTFTVYGISLPDDVDPLEIWHMPEIQATFFTLDESGARNNSSSSSESVWRIQLPHDIGEADAVMESQLHYIDQQQQNLDKIDSQLKTIEPSILGYTPYAFEGYNPQTTLLESINALRSSSNAFGIDETTVDYSVLYDRCEAIINRFLQVITRHGRVETRIGDDLVGLTRIDWNGDFETIWEEHAPTLSMHVHMKSVRLVSASRLAILRILSIAGTGALGLTIKASIPGGQYLLIPAVYKFICDMLKEFKKLPVRN